MTTTFSRNSFIHEIRVAQSVALLAYKARGNNCRQLCKAYDLIILIKILLGANLIS